MKHSRDWYIIPGDLHASLRELLHWHEWRETEIECFLEVLTEYEMRESPLLSDFQDALIREKSLSHLKKKIQTTALIGFIFTELDEELSHIPIVKTFASEGREMIRSIMKKIPK